MQRKENFLPFFIVFFSLSVFLILLGKAGVFNGAISFFNKSTLPIRTASISILGLGKVQNKEIKDLILENSNLQKKLIDKENLTSENKALKDQFAVTNPPSQSLLPAKVVGFPGLIPGTTLPQFLIIDKGLANGISVGNAVVVGNFLVGRVVAVSQDFSKVELVNSNSSNFAAKIEIDPENQVNGVLKGKGNDEMILDNVLLSQSLAKEQVVLTKGGIDENGKGYPPDLIIGKIISVEKKPSDLFQRAAVKSPIDFANLSIVFLLK